MEEMEHIYATAAVMRNGISTTFSSATQEP
jgi:hypothetical protein